MGVVIHVAAAAFPAGVQRLAGFSVCLAVKIEQQRCGVSVSAADIHLPAKGFLDVRLHFSVTSRSSSADACCKDWSLRAKPPP